MKPYLSMSGRRFDAPWCPLLGWQTLLGSGLLLGVAVALWLVPGRDEVTAKAAATIVILLVLAGTALFSVRGYRLDGRQLQVERLLWTTRIPLDELRAAEVAPDAMRRSIRLCGNGGLFAFTGWFRNRRLGTYRVFATDPARSVVLRFAHRRIVVTPDDPGSFAAALGSRGG